MIYQTNSNTGIITMIWFKLFTQPFHQDIDYSIIIELSANVLTFDNPFDNYKRF